MERRLGPIQSKRRSPFFSEEFGEVAVLRTLNDGQDVNLNAEFHTERSREPPLWTTGKGPVDE